MKAIKISAMWCSACLVMKKVYKKMEEKHPEIKVTNYDYDMDEDKVSEYKVGSIIPVLIFVDDNDNEISRLIGEKSIEEIELEINKIKGK